MSLQTSKGTWFDSEAVIKDAGAKAAAAFAQFGRYVTLTASRSMRKAGKRGASSKSSPGQPPRWHGTGLLRRHIYFDWDTRTRSIVMGPAKMTTRSKVSDVPHILEYGGSTKVLCGTPKEITVHKKGRKSKRTIYVNKVLQTKHIAPRPYMGPAVQKSWSRFKWPQGVAPAAVAVR